MILFAVFAAACSSSQQSAEKIAEDTSAVQETYTFDVVEDEPLPSEPVVAVTTEPVKYIVQLGAFTSEDRAKRFIEESKSLLQDELELSFSEKVGLFVVQLPAFDTREQAEIVRNGLWKIEKFKDAFIVPQE